MSKKVKYTQADIDTIVELHLQGFSSRKICKKMGLAVTKKSTINNILSRFRNGKETYSHSKCSLVLKLPKVLTLDVELSPTQFYGWGMFNQFFGLNQIVDEWFLLSYSAKWLHEENVMYKDMRGKVATGDDTELLQDLYELLDEADIVVGQNHRKFDLKKINARLLMKGFDKPYSPVKTEDTLDIAKRKFGFTSNKLEWMTEHLNVEFKKLKHGNYAGFELWKACMNEDIKAWDEMKEYNIYDSLSTEELWLKLRAWDDKSVNFALYLDDTHMRCSCGSTGLKEAGFAYTALSKFQQYQCEDCGSFLRGRTNLFSKDKRTNLLMNVINR